MHYPEPISKLIDSFMKLPGIGPKTAQRLAFYVLNMKEDDVVNFSRSLMEVKRDLQFCSVCGHITDIDPRSEERRVGKERRSRRSRYHYEKKRRASTLQA